MLMKSFVFPFLLTLNTWTNQPSFEIESNQKKSFRALFADEFNAQTEEKTLPRLLADFNRDGQIDFRDRILIKENSELNFLVLANLDDDDLDGKVDHDDPMINGSTDLLDLAKVEIDNPGQIKNLFLKISGDTENFQVFNGATRKLISIDENLLKLDGIGSLLFEAKGFARRNHSGSIVLELLENGKAHGVLEAKVAPWIMLANSNPTETVYIASGHRNYANKPMIDMLGNILSRKEVELHVHRPWGQQASNGSGQFHEMWVQDGMEIGYTQIPGSDLMYVVLKGLRATEKLAPKLLTKNFGIVEIGRPRFLSGGDSWADWMGNLEVSSPVPGFPLGRIYYGINRDTGIGLHPEVVDFLEAQAVQSPFSINTNWLTIKHVDEIFNFIPAQNGQFKMIIASPGEASKILSNSSHNNQYNRNIQREINQTKAIIQSKLGLLDRDIMDLPVFYQNGHNLWSNPINSIHINGTVIFGSTFLPQIIRSDLISKMKSLGLNTAFVDDNRYQRNYGNVHCATNTKKTPSHLEWWKHIAF